MAVPERAILDEIKGLLERARASALTRDAALKIRERAEEFTRGVESAGVAALLSQILQATEEAILGSEPAPTRRGRALQRELQTATRATPAQIREALRASGLTGDTDLGLDEARHLQQVLFPSLRALRSTYEEAGFDTEERLTAVREQLRNLIEAIPGRIAQPRRFLQELAASLESRVQSTLARRRLEEIGRRLQAMLDTQTGLDSLGELEKALAEAGRTRDLSADPSAARVSSQIRRLEDLRTAYEDLDRVPMRVAGLAPAGEFRTALDELADGYRRANEGGLLHRAPLDRAAAIIAAELRRVLRDERQAASSDREPGMDSLRDRIDTLSRIRDWLTALPSELTEELDRECLDLAKREAERLAGILAAIHVRSLRELAIEEVASYSEGLIRSEEPVLQELGLELRERWLDFDAMRNVTDDAEEAGLRRLEGVGSELGPGPFADEALGLARRYRAAAEVLREIEADLESSSRHRKELLQRLKPIAGEFPAWKRVARLMKRVEDADLLRALKSAAAKGAPVGIRRALAQAASLSDEDLRDKIQRALSQLEQAAVWAMEAEKAHKRLAAAAGLAGRERAIDGVVAKVRGYLPLTEGSEDSRREFPSAWRHLDEIVTPLLMDHLPHAVEGWLDETVPEAANRESIERCRSRFGEWNDLLQNDFLADRADRLLQHRAAQLDVRDLVSGGSFDQALARLGESKSLFDALDYQALEAELERGRAVDRFRAGRDPELEEVMSVLYRHGADETLLECVVQDFREHGSTRRLASLARERGEELQRFEEIALLAGWCLMFEREQLEDLAGDLATTASQPQVETFCGSIARSDAVIKALHCLSLAVGRAITWRSAVEKAARDAIATLRGRLNPQLKQLEAELKGLIEESRGELESYGRLRRDDAALREALAGAFERARLFLEHADAVLGESDCIVGPLRRWAATTGRPAMVESLIRDLDEFRDRLQRSVKVLDQLHDAHEMTLRTHPESLSELLSLRLLGGGSIGLVAGVFSLLTTYYQDWLRVLKPFMILVQCYRHGGVGLTSSEVESLRRTLEGDLRYDFSPAADRFELLALLGDTSYLSFIEKLQAMVREVEAVDAHEAACQAAEAAIGDRLRLRLSRYDAAADGEREVEREGIAELLEQVVSPGRPASDALASPPTPQDSEVAASSLERVRRESWYQSLQRALRIQDSRR